MTGTNSPETWLQAELDARAAHLKQQPPTRRDITRRNAIAFATALDALERPESRDEEN